MSQSISNIEIGEPLPYFILKELYHNKNNINEEELFESTGLWLSTFLKIIQCFVKNGLVQCTIRKIDSSDLIKSDILYPDKEFGFSLSDTGNRYVEKVILKNRLGAPNDAYDIVSLGKVGFKVYQVKNLSIEEFKTSYQKHLGVNLNEAYYALTGKRPVSREVIAIQNAAMKIMKPTETAYNLFIKSKDSERFNIIGINKKQLDKLKSAYLNGDKNVTIAGKIYPIEKPQVLSIYQHHGDKAKRKEQLDFYFTNIHWHSKSIPHGKYLPEKTLLKLGEDVTYDVIGDSEFAENKHKTTELVNSDKYIDESIINKIKALKNSNFDFTRLIQLCNELNYNYENSNYLSVGMICRTIINHIPPAIKADFTKFNEVCDNYGGAKSKVSFKRSMTHLNNSLKNIADSYLHDVIEKKVHIPSKNQVDFRADIEVLLAEIIKVNS